MCLSLFPFLSSVCVFGCRLPRACRAPRRARLFLATAAVWCWERARGLFLLRLRSPWGCFALPQPRGEGLADSPACLFGRLRRSRGVKCGAPTAAAPPRVAAERTRAARRTDGLTVGPTAGTVAAAAARAQALLISCGARRRMHASRSGHVFVFCPACLFVALPATRRRCWRPARRGARSPFAAFLTEARAAARWLPRPVGRAASPRALTNAWRTARPRRCSTVAVGF
ncbi:uncharacterized protein Tco025E_08844 [Trypanosoma conorhini]|uniref:Uncharacterized protein n=1 Tax=Trypanosoma conorhini TaxID=83891 RepID=A0A3R7NCE9_9TRYP|nr:uncharacterized protein Tco025E_08844 [Trypanosoma conorhini]RNF00573.1 hypothetical protein Tco025E_08844 [Trypanosoma conorhini]